MRKVAGGLLQLLLALAALCAATVAEVVNTEFIRTIDTTAAVVRISITAKATGVQDSYIFAFPKDIAAHIAYFEVTEGAKNLPVADVKDRWDLCVCSIRCLFGCFV